MPSPGRAPEAAGQETAKAEVGTLGWLYKQDGCGGLGRGQGRIEGRVVPRRRNGSPELRDRHRGWKEGRDSRVNTREGSLEAGQKVSMGTMDSTSGELALLALELHF